MKALAALDSGTGMRKLIFEDLVLCSSWGQCIRAVESGYILQM